MTDRARHASGKSTSNTMMLQLRATLISTDITRGKEFLRRLLLATTVVLGFCCAQAQPGPKGPGNHPGPPHDPRVATPNEAAATIQHAYDAISHTAHLGNSDGVRRIVNVNEIESESKTAYQEALSCYQASDYVGAREQAMASADLSRALEELVMSGQGSGRDASQPVPPALAGERDRSARDLENLNYRLRELRRRLTEGRPLPGETAALLQSLVNRGEQLQREAQDLLLHGQAVRAGHMARVGDALTHAAEHIQNRYLLADDILPAPLGRPPGRERRPPTPPDPGEGTRR
jgi:hypothetical protein